MTKWIIESGPLPEMPTFGSRQAAEVAVSVYVDDDGKRGYYHECLCAACSTIYEVGIEDAIGDRELEEGTHYMKHHVEVYPGVPGTSETEYDVWLIDAEVGEDSTP